MKVRIDRARCQAKTQCISAAPEVFALDDERKAMVKDGMTPVPEPLVKRTRLAARMCPVDAVLVEEDT